MASRRAWRPPPTTRGPRRRRRVDSAPRRGPSSAAAVIAGSSNPTTRPKRTAASRKSPAASAASASASRAVASSRDSRPVRDGSGRDGWPGVVHRADDTRLARMCGRFTQERPASELAEIFAAEPLADELGPALQRRPDRRRARRRPARGAAGDHRVPLGPRPALVDRPQGRLADVQRPGRDDHHEPGLPRRLQAAPLPRPGRFVLRVEARGDGPPALPGRARRRAAAGAGRAVGRLEGPVDRAGPPHVHDRDDDAERGDGRPPRPDAGASSRRTPGSAGCDPDGRPSPASCWRCSSRPTRSRSASTPSTAT